MTKVEVSVTEEELKLLKEITRCGPSTSQALRMILKAGFKVLAEGGYRAVRPWTRAA